MSLTRDVRPLTTEGHKLRAGNRQRASCSDSTLRGCQGGGSELAEREPDPKKRTNECSAEAGGKGEAKGREGGKAGRREEGGQRAEGDT